MLCFLPLRTIPFHLKADWASCIENSQSLLTCSGFGLYATFADCSTIKKDIATAEAGLSKLEQQEAKYSFELETALNEYVDLREQGKAYASAELYAQRMVLRPDKTTAVVDRLQSTYCEKYDPLIMFDSQRDVADLLHENAEDRAYRMKRDTRKQQKRREKNDRTENER